MSRVTLRRDGWRDGWRRVGTTDLAAYGLFVDTVRVGTVHGVDPSPYNEHRPTAWQVATALDGARHSRLSEVREWAQRNADALLAAHARR